MATKKVVAAARMFHLALKKYSRGPVVVSSMKKLTRNHPLTKTRKTAMRLRKRRAKMTRMTKKKRTSQKIRKRRVRKTRQTRKATDRRSMASSWSQTVADLTMRTGSN